MHKEDVKIYIYMHTQIVFHYIHMYIIKCYLVSKNELLPFVTTRMDLEGIMQGKLHNFMTSLTCEI